MNGNSKVYRNRLPRVIKEEGGKEGEGSI